MGLLVSNWLVTKATELADTSGYLVEVARDLHIVPEFRGNRAPFTDPRTDAVIAGLDMDKSLGSLVSFFFADLYPLIYGLRRIVETQTDHGTTIKGR